MSFMNINPFAVQTPEDIKAEDVIELFVNVFSDYPNLPKVGHTFLHGPRGSGKSMMFRYMLPDCQRQIRDDKPRISDLDYFSIYVPIKKTEINIVETSRLAKHANVYFNEHLLTTHVLNRLFEYFATKHDFHEDEELLAEKIVSFHNTEFAELLKLAGYQKEVPVITNDISIKKIFQAMLKLSSEIQSDTLRYIKKLAFLPEGLPYEGPLCSFLDFFVPLVEGLVNTGLLASDKPAFLLFDDADNLTLVQTQILNTWVSYRTSSKISIKISTQLAYKTYWTISGNRIDSPHDYSEVNIATIYTTKTDFYVDRVKDIVQRRLKLYGYADSNAEKFFPRNEAQEEAIEKIAENLRAEWIDSGRGYRPGDDAYRYARPDYIRQLHKGKSGFTYSYSGFQQLVHISSGIVRFFLEPASIMFGEMLKMNPDIPITRIEHGVQNRVIREFSDSFLMKELKSLIDEEDKKEMLSSSLVNLRNLIEALGGLFKEILISDSAERRVFSIAISNKLDMEVQEVLKLGVRLGYFQESVRGNKEGTGRTEKYILSRRLAPFFTLDPSGFAGDQFITNEKLKLAMNSPKKFIAEVGKTRVKGNDLSEYLESNIQLDLFSENQQ